MNPVLPSDLRGLALSLVRRFLFVAESALTGAVAALKVGRSQQAPVNMVGLGQSRLCTRLGLLFGLLSSCWSLSAVADPRSGASDMVVRATINGTEADPTSVPLGGEFRFLIAAPRSRDTSSSDFRDALGRSVSGLNGGGVGSGGGSSPSTSQQATPPVKDNSDSCTKSGMPVKLSTGEKLKDQFDYPAGAAYGIPLTRTYRSNHAVGTMFGPQWTANVDFPRLTWSAECIPQQTGGCARRTATVAFPDGTRYEYLLGQFWLDGGESPRRASVGASLEAKAAPDESSSIVGAIPLSSAANTFAYTVRDSLATGSLTFFRSTINAGVSYWVLRTAKQSIRYSASGFVQSVTTDSGASTQFGVDLGTGRVNWITSPTGDWTSPGPATVSPRFVITPAASGCTDTTTTIC